MSEWKTVVCDPERHPFIARCPYTDCHKFVSFPAKQERSHNHECNSCGREYECVAYSELLPHGYHHIARIHGTEGKKVGLMSATGEY